MDKTDARKGRNSAAKSGRVSRRSFLGTTAAATALTIVPSHVLGRAGQVPPSEKVNMAFIGVGWQGM